MPPLGRYPIPYTLALLAVVDMLGRFSTVSTFIPGVSTFLHSGYTIIALILVAAGLYRYQARKYALFDQIIALKREAREILRKNPTSAFGKLPLNRQHWSARPGENVTADIAAAQRWHDKFSAFEGTWRIRYNRDWGWDEMMSAFDEDAQKALSGSTFRF